MRVISMGLFVSLIFLTSFLFPQDQGGESVVLPQVSAVASRNIMYLDIDGTEFRIPSVSDFDKIILRYHKPSHLVYVFYEFEDKSHGLELITYYPIKKQGSRDFYRNFLIEKPFRTQKVQIDQDRLPISGAVTKGNVVFAPLTKKLYRVAVQGDNSQDDIFVPSKQYQKTQYVRAQDFVALNPPLSQDGEGFADIDRSADIDFDGSDAQNEDTSEGEDITQAVTSDDDQGVRKLYDDGSTAVDVNRNKEVTVHYGLHKIIVLPES